MTVLTQESTTLAVVTQEIIDGRWEASFYADPNRATAPRRIMPPLEVPDAQVPAR